MSTFNTPLATPSNLTWSLSYRAYLLVPASVSKTHIEGLLQLLRSSLEVFRLVQLLLQLVQEGVFLLQVGEQLAPARPHLLHHGTRAQSSQADRLANKTPKGQICSIENLWVRGMKDINICESELVNRTRWIPKLPGKWVRHMEGGETKGKEGEKKVYVYAYVGLCVWMCM